MPAEGQPREHPLLFKGAMVRAILAGDKTQTRRPVTAHNSSLDGKRIGRAGRLREIWDGLDWAQAVVDPGPSPAGNPGPYFKVPYPIEDTWHRVYPIYRAGDVVWGRETWMPETEQGIATGGIIYKATDRPEPDGVSPLRWRASIHMPRRACRLILPLSGVRAGFVQGISETDAVAEGVYQGANGHYANYPSGATVPGWASARESFRTLWDSINAPRGLGWAENPPVWALTFTARRGA